MIRRDRTTGVGTIAAVVALAAAGCYAGLDDAAADAADDGAATDAADDGDDAAADGEDDAADDGAPSDAAVAPSEVARLTRVEYERTIVAIFGEAIAAEVSFAALPADGKVGRFVSNAGLNVNIDVVDGYRLVAEDVGEAAATQATTLLGCADSPACAEQFIRDTGRLVYRRPLTAAEVAVFVEFWTVAHAEGGLADAVRLTVTAMLQTPDFLYRLERGADGEEGPVRRLTGYELASRLSFFLWKSGPDGALLDAAEAGALDTPEGLADQTARLLADPRADYTILRFHEVWLGIDELDGHLVDNAVFPEFEGLRDDMMAETERFVLHVIREGDAQLASLFTAPYSFASPELAALYGDAVLSVDGDRIELDPSQRKGILTQAAYLTTHAATPERAPIYRGTSVLVDVLCNGLPPPPDVDTAISFDSTASARAQIEEATAQTGCRGCHSMINPVGFLFENYDAIGRWRTMDGAFEVDAAATVVGTDVDGDYPNALALVDALAGSRAAAKCVSRQWLRYALSRVEGVADEASIAAAADQADGDIRVLIGAITQSDAFRYRRLPDPA